MIAMDSKQQPPQQNEIPPPQYEAGRSFSDRPYPQPQPSNIPSTHSNHGPVTLQPPPQAMLGQEKSPAQIGEEYRAALFAECAHGRHVATTRYGLCGILTAVFCFPCGLICLFSDSEQRCDRCGVALPG